MRRMVTHFGDEFVIGFCPLTLTHHGVHLVVGFEKIWFGIEDCSSHDFHEEGFDGLQKQHLMRKKWFEKEMRNWIEVRIMQKSQENGQNWTITDTGMEKSAQEPGECYQRNPPPWQSYTSPNAPIGGNPQGECHADARKHTKIKIVALKDSQKKHKGQDQRERVPDSGV
ncbi:hypothetical protein Tco_0427726 [Tanacetum coccineum]